MDSVQTPGKRKRETDIPRITYHAENRTFDRLFRENTLDETKDVVRTKLGLSDSTEIYLTQIRGQHTVDLDDDDDFDAFYAIAHTKMQVDVRVTTGDTPQNGQKHVHFFPVSENLPPAKRRKPNSAVSSTSPQTPDDASMQTSLALEVPHSEPSPITVSPAATSSKESTSAVDTQTNPEAPPKKKSKKTKRADTESPEGAAPNTVDSIHETETIVTKKPKKKTKKVSDTVPVSFDEPPTSPKDLNVTTVAPVAVPKSTRKSKKDANTDVNAFYQSLAETINDGNNGSAEHPLDDQVPPPKKRTTKAKASDKPTKGKSAVNGTSETVEPEGITIQSIANSSPILVPAKAKPKKKKKEEKIIRAPTPVELDAVRDTIQQILIQRDLERSKASASSKEDTVSSVPTPARPAKPPSSASLPPLPKVVSSANILAAAKQRGANRPAPNADRPAETAPVPTKLSLAHSPASESSDEDGDYDIDQVVSKPPLPIPTPNPAEPFADINLEDLIRGPGRRLTLDSVLPAAIASSSRKRNAVVLEEEPIVKQPKSGKWALSIRPSAWSDSESDDAGYESATAEEAETNGHKMPHSSSIVNISNDSKTDSIGGLDEHAVPDDQTPISPSIEEMSVGRSTVLSDNVSALATEQALPDSLPTEEHDPIEPIIPSPRSHSPIESVLATMTPLVNNTPATKTPLKPVTGLRRSNRNPASQPLSKHEADVRESVVRLTRNRSKQNVQTTVQAATASPSIPQPSPRRLRSASKPRSTVNRGPVASQESSAPRRNTVEPSWTTLKPDLPSSSPAPESTLADELQSLPNDEQPSTTPRASDVAYQQPSPDPAPSGNPLFLASDSQVDFPYSQFQDIADTDTGAEELMPTVGRLERDSEEEDEVEETITVKTSRRGSTTYRGLSQITGQNKFFAGFHSQSVIASTPKNSKEDMYGPMSQAYNDDASDSDSENEKSHIPRSRRAGNKQ